ncbi:hypothetical protein AQI70_36540 [Streptomyces curacoi]|uniref:Uncharacterized protein n=1 Tax=Streptomyces curacoi TaxID=146536 RepID=A0A117NTJ9_9ACTN|nr:hypothetical protein AQI70_36540 [Streptomyces curacoi]
MAVTTATAAMPAMTRTLPEDDSFLFMVWLVLSLSSGALPAFADADGEDWARGPCLGPLGISLVSAAYGRMTP